LVRDRVKEVKGSVKIKSEADKGTLFFFSIPIQPPAPQKAQAPVAQKVPAPPQAPVAKKE
jgi:hypothetical protein